jgi:flagellar biosynthesis regulator FlaF
MYKLALKAYENAQKTTIQLEELERLVIARTTNKLTSARDNFTHSKESYDKYANALKHNQKLWTLIQSNIIDNPTSGTKSLRKSLLNLSLFIDKQTITALRNPDPDNITSLIEINKSISSGLHSQKNPSDMRVQADGPNIDNTLR